MRLKVVRVEVPPFLFFVFSRPHCETLEQGEYGGGGC